MENNLTPEEQIEALRLKLNEQEQEIESLKQSRIVVQQNTQENFLKVIAEMGIPLVGKYLESTAEENRYNMDKEVELEKEEMKVIDKLDTKEKIYKGILLVICLTALVLSALYIEKAEVVIPVLSLIIGLLFKSNTLSDFFSHAKRKLNSPNDEE